MMPVPQTISQLLGGDDPHWVERALDEAEVAHRVLGRAGQLATALVPVFEQRIGEALRSALEVGLGGLIVAGWQRHNELVAAGRRTRDAPGTREDVVLAEHEIRLIRGPAVEVRLEGRPVATLTFDVTVTMTVRGVVAEVHRGMVVALRLGDVVAGAKLSLGEQKLAAREVKCVVGALVHVGRGLPLVPAEAQQRPRIH